MLGGRYHRLATPLPWFTCDDFAELVGETFEVAVDQDPIALQLLKATEGDDLGGPGPAGQTRKQFSLVFRGDLEQPLAQGTYRLKHAQLDEIELFLVPLGPDQGSMQYEAAFA